MRRMFYVVSIAVLLLAGLLAAAAPAFASSAGVADSPAWSAYSLFKQDLGGERHRTTGVYVFKYSAGPNSHGTFVMVISAVYDGGRTESSVGGIATIPGALFLANGADLSRLVLKQVTVPLTDADDKPVGDAIVQMTWTGEGTIGRDRERNVLNPYTGDYLKMTSGIFREVVGNGTLTLPGAGTFALEAGDGYADRWMAVN